MVKELLAVLKMPRLLLENCRSKVMITLWGQQLKIRLRILFSPPGSQHLLQNKFIEVCVILSKHLSKFLPALTAFLRNRICVKKLFLNLLGKWWSVVSKSCWVMWNCQKQYPFPIKFWCNFFISKMKKRF